MILKTSVLLFTTVFLFACNDNTNDNDTNGIDSTKSGLQNDSATASLPEPFATESVKKFSNVIGWPQGKTPVAPNGFTVTKFADGFKNPRWIYVANNGDIFISEANTEVKGIKKIEAEASGKAESQQLSNSANRITLLRDTNQDGRPDFRTVFLENLNQPFGMLILNNHFYVANTDGLWRYPYQDKMNKMSGQGEKIVDLPAGGYNNHWTRNIIANGNGSKIYIAVGSASNVGEHGMEDEVRRACILEVDPDGKNERIYAAGLRNPVGMDWAPGSNVLWTAVNERDELGDELVPDYITGVQEGGFYGWPYAYFGANEDPRRKGENPQLVSKTIVPDVQLGSHTASLGLAFYDKTTFPEKYRDGAFIGQHGSWNRSELSGYKVTFVPFSNGRPAGPMEDFLTGFIADAAEADVYGRPVAIAVLPDGSLLITDDTSNTLWHVKYTAEKN